MHASKVTCQSVTYFPGNGNSKPKLEMFYLYWTSLLNKRENMSWFTLCWSVLSNLSEDRLSTLKWRLRRIYTSRSRDPPTLRCRLSVLRLISGVSHASIRYYSTPHLSRCKPRHALSFSGRRCLWRHRTSLVTRSSRPTLARLRELGENRV